MTPENMSGIQLNGKEFQRRLRWLIFYAWNIPPVFGLVLILMIGVLQPSQMIGILTTPLEPAYILGWFAFSMWFLPRQIRPVADWLDQKPGSSHVTAQQAVRRFPLVFWATFLIYLAVAPASVIIAAEIYTGFVATPYDWFRIELVALIVSIIVGLPIFFLIFDLFGSALGALKLARPIVTIRTKVFLIGALVPLLIDTMLVQYYWTRTGYFTIETFGVWLLLEALAIGGSLIFAHSFSQSLSPLQELAGATDLLPVSSIETLRARSTDEIGVLTADYRTLLEEQRLHTEILELNNRLLRSTGEELETGKVFQEVVALCCDAVHADQAFVMLYDHASSELVDVVHSGSDYRPEGYHRFRLDDLSLAVWAFKQGQTVAVTDAKNDPRVNPAMVEKYNVSAALATPLQIGDSVIGVLIAVTNEHPYHYTARDILLIEGLAREAAFALHAQQLRVANVQAEAELRIAATAFESQVAMMVTDASSVILRINKAFTDTTGYTAEDVIGKTPRLLHSGKHDDAFYRAMWESIKKTGGWQGEIWDRRKNGDIYPQWLNITAVNDETGTVTHYISTQFDISLRKQAEEKINELAFFDQLTGLPNRTLLMDRLKQAIAASTRSGNYGALLLIDLDNFKTLNDTLGHDMGDQLLQQVAQRLKQCVREGDTVARLGGDEFVVILAGLSAVESEASSSIVTIAEKILATLNDPFQFGIVQHHSSASMGVTLFKGDQASMDVLLKQADLSMYESKKAGRNAVHFFNPAMQTSVTERAALEEELRTAIRENQFIIHYQAQVAGTGRVIGAEALVRWLHPLRGMVSPAEFIPSLEETRLILPLGMWVLESACSQLAAWAKQPHMAHLSLAVNVSANQLHHENFVGQVMQALSVSGANPKRLKLELTESLLVSDVEDAIVKMAALKAQGVGFSLDDFGTGYSSLSYLKRLPLDQLKIDQNFVMDILTDTNDAAIAKMVIVLADSLGLTVIAEGVEIEAQRDFLARHGCHTYQGYLFSSPLAADEFEEFVKRF